MNTNFEDLSDVKASKVNETSFTRVLLAKLKFPYKRLQNYLANVVALLITELRYSVNIDIISL